MDTGWVYVGIAFALAWIVLLGYVAYLQRRARQAAAALTGDASAPAGKDADAAD